MKEKIQPEAHPDYNQGKGLRRLTRRLCFMVIGICALANPLEFLNLYNIGFGILCGLLFGGLFRMFLKGFLGMLNGHFKKEKGKAAIRYTVDNGMLFLVPFALMLAIAVFYLGWSITAPFISAGIMAVGTASAIEMGKMQGKQGIKNTIATSVVSFCFSYLWTMSFTYLNRAPSLIEGGVGLLRSLMGGGGI
ncbi:hypothetical protein [Syntrophomonas wolfei]|uniref:hypothetical protein n=1 Tax=Syntrophomonas wolfei TaxID=863 RepID=UPI0023F53336|nr:hypothetical protein [Syntrophomonas wolfei]